MVIRTLDNPDYYLNRSLSWLSFNRRVLEEAEDESNPLLERVKFLAITASNLDEFFEVRVASLLQRIEDGHVDPGPDGLTPMDERAAVSDAVHKFVREQYECWNARLRPALADSGIHIYSLSQLDEEARDFVDDYCLRELDPLLTPVTVDPAHPFPRVLNKALCQALLLRRRRRASSVYMGVVTVPRALPRLVRLPGEHHYAYIALADLVAMHAARMYRGYEIISEGAFRITRNSNLYLQEEESRSVLESVRTELHNRRKGDAVRMEIEADASDEVVSRLQPVFDLEDWQVFRTAGPVNLSRLSHLYSEVDRPDLKFKPFIAREWALPKGTSDVFAALRQKDVLLHHPYDSYNAVVSFIERAAKDPSVLSIKQTLYRTNTDSPIVQALMQAAATKEVTVVVEVKARFDEASNIKWARDMEDAGVQVFHGLVGLKTHCKLALIARKDSDGVMRRYLHLGTGNYNPTTAQFYTDLSMLTANQTLTDAAHKVFNFLTAYAEQPSYDPLLVAPVDLAERTINLIARETAHARAGRKARIIAKVNSLLDKNVVQELYRASQAGVQIDLIVRGICSLNPGVRGVSDRIRVRSIVGRFLEHSRIFYFENDGNPELYLGSADWMPRNLYERVEVVFPVLDPMLRTRIMQEILAAQLADTAKARILRRDGVYLREERRGAPLFNSQEFLIEVAEGKKDFSAIPSHSSQNRRKPVRTRKPRVRESVAE
ncbi:MAG TPA: polyphosphate kinase 1 [candidate division Zixibacteria bacterium]|nr:polyphosphate kinase 1 [candidate division Zixibacteria bacterium]